MTPRPVVWIDLDNTPHVPFFRPITTALQSRNCDVVVTARDAYNVTSLLKLYKLECTTIGRHFGGNKIMKVVGLGVRSWQLLSFIREYRPQLAVSHGSRAQVLAAKMLGVPSVVIADYEHVTHVTRPDWLIVPDVIPDSATKQISDKVLRYPGIKEDVYASTLVPDTALLGELGIEPTEILVTVRPPAKEAHYHNPRSDDVFEAVLKLLLDDSRTRVVMLPRNVQQEADVRMRFARALESRKIIIPAQSVNGLNMVWNSDFVISGGGTMNREAAALDVPVYSTFCGKIGAVDQYLASHDRLVLLQDPAEVGARVCIEKRVRSSASHIAATLALDTIVEHLLKISCGEPVAAMPPTGAPRSGSVI
jgi:predicted glycosyltransferase